MVGTAAYNPSCGETQPVRPSPVPQQERPVAALGTLSATSALDQAAPPKLGYRWLPLRLEYALMSWRVLK